jgi:hypothetical protein
VASVHKRTIPTERPPLVSEVSANIFADRGCHVVSWTVPYGRIFGFLDRIHYFFFEVAPQLYSRGWVDPVPDPLLFFLVVRGNRTRNLRICSQELWLLDHRGGLMKIKGCKIYEFRNVVHFWSIFAERKAMTQTDNWLINKYEATVLLSHSQ